MRGQMYDGIWVDSCLGRYKGKDTVISDTRFPNEVNQIRARGGKIIRVKKGPDPEWFVNYVEGNIIPKNVHSSEYLWARSEFDLIINNDGDLNDLNKSVDNMIMHLLQDHQYSTRGVALTSISGS
jgi:hypothetical protein